MMCVVYRAWNMFYCYVYNQTIADNGWKILLVLGKASPKNRKAFENRKSINDNNTEDKLMQQYYSHWTIKYKHTLGNKKWQICVIGLSTSIIIIIVGSITIYAKIIFGIESKNYKLIYYFAFLFNMMIPLFISTICCVLSMYKISKFTDLLYIKQEFIILSLMIFILGTSAVCVYSSKFIPFFNFLQINLENDRRNRIIACSFVSVYCVMSSFVMITWVLYKYNKKLAQNGPKLKKTVPLLPCSQSRGEDIDSALIISHKPQQSGDINICIVPVDNNNKRKSRSRSRSISRSNRDSNNKSHSRSHSRSRSRSQSQNHSRDGSISRSKSKSKSKSKSGSCSRSRSLSRTSKSGKLRRVNLNTVIQHEVGFCLFMRYLVDEYAIENLLFCTEVIQFKNKSKQFDNIRKLEHNDSYSSGNENNNNSNSINNNNNNNISAPISPHPLANNQNCDAGNSDVPPTQTTTNTAPLASPHASNEAININAKTTGTKMNQSTVISVNIPSMDSSRSLVGGLGGAQIPHLNPQISQSWSNLSHVYSIPKLDAQLSIPSNTIAPIQQQNENENQQHIERIQQQIEAKIQETKPNLHINLSNSVNLSFGERIVQSQSPSAQKQQKSVANSANSANSVGQSEKRPSLSERLSATILIRQGATNARNSNLPNDEQKQNCKASSKSSGRSSKSLQLLPKRSSKSRKSNKWHTNKFPRLPDDVPMSNIMKKDNLFDKIEMIMDRYIVDSAELQVNVSSQVRNDLSQQRDWLRQMKSKYKFDKQCGNIIIMNRSQNQNEDENQDQDIEILINKLYVYFDAACREIWLLLRSSFANFSKSEAYRKLEAELS